MFFGADGNSSFGEALNNAELNVGRSEAQVLVGVRYTVVFNIVWSL